MVDGQHRAIHHDSREVHGPCGGGEDRGARLGRHVDAAMASGVRGGRSDVALGQSRRRHRPQPPRRRGGRLHGHVRSGKGGDGDRLERRDHVECVYCLDRGGSLGCLDRRDRVDCLDCGARFEQPGSDQGGNGQRRVSSERPRHRPRAMSAHAHPPVPFRPAPSSPLGGPPRGAPAPPTTRIPSPCARRPGRPGSVHNPSHPAPCAEPRTRHACVSVRDVVPRLEQGRSYRTGTHPRARGGTPPTQPGPPRGAPRRAPPPQTQRRGVP